jgi:hypothetical protein
MNRDELLTKLAMEHSPEDWGGADTWTYDEHEYGWNEYQLRRTELINKPSWDDAPEWAEWLAQDGGGEWCFYPEKPEQSGTMWINDEPKNGIWVDVHCTGRIPAGQDWRETLEPRPEPKSDIKTCRHCDIEFRRPNVDGIPDDRCTRCDDEIKALWPEREPAKSWWTSKTCTECGHTTAAKVSDDNPVCPECVALGPDISDAGLDVSSGHSGAGPDVSSGQYAKAPCGSDMEARSKYHREVKPGVWIDVYDVLMAFGVTNPADQHAIKKMLMPGKGGHKGGIQDRREAIQSLHRAIELEEGAQWDR